MIHNYFKTALSLIILLLFSITLHAQIISPFTSVYQTNQRGGIVFLSNVALGCSANPPASTGACLATSAEAILGTGKNDNFLSAYVDIDLDPSTFMSSSDSLNLSACSRITKAFLFWGASGHTTPGLAQVKLKVNDGVYVNVNALSTQTNTTGFDSYHNYADVTALIAPAGAKARITVADIPSSMVGSMNTFGSWNLVVVYKNDAMNMRQLTVFNGLVNVSAATPTVDLHLSGFLTPATGTVGFEVGLYSHDGDRSTLGDDLLFNGNLSFLPLADLVSNLVGDIFNSTVSNNGILTPFRKPLLNNTLGLDADIFSPPNLLNVTLGNSATTASIALTTAGDEYLTQAVTTAIDTYDPELQATVRVRDVNGGTLNPGDILEYRIKGLNIGTDASVNTFLIDTLDAGVNYIPNSTSIVFGANLGLKTDLAGDDQADYDPLNRILKVRVGAGANLSLGGALNGSLSGSDSTVVTFSVSLGSGCLKYACNNNIVARAYIAGSGSVFPTYNSTVTSTPGTMNGSGCRIFGPTTVTVSTVACATPTVSSSSPICAGGSIFLNVTPEPGATYSWSGPGAFVSALQNPTIVAATTSLSGIYTVTVTVPSATCSASASTSVTVNACIPIATSDFTNTTANVPVSGNMGANDINAANGATFTILNQPGGGTVTINPSTGQYTFTPGTGFTGITTATYQLCNSLPVVCVTTSITFTVYPTLVANPDNINTAPSATTSGNFMANDSGTATGVSYSLNVTTIPSTTGTLTVNPATGQYTFAPNAAFTGSAQAGYTVCNMTVHPPQCSSSSFTINVQPNPAPVNDAITTLINTPVSGNVATNDNGVAGGTFAIVNQPASGTITINAATGQFTYTPTSTFTGITTSTYNLCNGAPVSCSTAVISITVFPNIVANPDLINTTPLTTTTGSLLTNDGGIVTGGSYSVSITQPAASTGTILLNPATGQYTFIPNILFTGSVQSTYTVCNTGINPQQCSNTTFTILVTNLPVAVNDGTATVINTAVNGNVATNDSGTLLGSFTFSTVSASTGTINGNPATGAYSFTPATGFTGTTSTTYTLCNLLSPPCSTASITFTVYPTLIANPDVIITTPSVSAVGNFVTNDTGVTPGANYNITVTQPSAGAGTITINAITGQYTFVPNPAFAGTAQASYTICNVSVNPQQCSNTTITLTVKPVPAPVDDHVFTTVNFSVTGNAATNDLGAASGTFAIVGQPANGTITINAATGQFTFTPALNFTGVTTATYNLCNGAPSSCSTAVIMVSVFPDLVANPDAVATTPSVTTNGNLLSNDTGINAAAVYSVTITQPAPSTGTFVIDPATGNYTFMPNPAFMGLAQASYTVCNVSVNPQQCSNTTINIAVGNLAVAVNDNTLTLINTNVSGDVSINDSNFSGGTFNFGSPTTGTLTTNNSTGQYTFAPAAGFTGIASVSYTLCNIYSPPCATALLTFTVYPAVTANPETIMTVINTSVTGNLATNDTGITPGGNYSISITPVAAGIGTLTVNAAGQYTFIPAANYTGNSTTTYTLAQYNGSVLLQSSVATVTVIVTSGGSPLGIAKSVSNVAYNTDGTFYLTYKLVVKNYSNVELKNVSVVDDLSGTFPLPATYTVTSPPSLNNASGSGLALLSGYTGTANSSSLTLSSNSILDPGRVDSILFTVKVDPHNSQVAYNNTASVSAVTSGSTVTDVSTDGLNPDPDNDGDPGNNSSVTTFTFNLVRIGIAKATGISQSTGNGCYEVTFKFTVKNYGSTPIYNIQVIDNLDNTFGAQTSYTVLAPVTSANGYLAANTLFNGSSNNNMTASSSTLGVGKTDTLMLRVRYCSADVVSFSNTAIAYGTSMPGGGFIGYDTSTSGLDPDPNHDNDPSENDITRFESSEDFMIPQGFSPNSDGLNDRFEIKGLRAFPNLEVTILNRWGAMVYNKKQYDNSWDGKSTEGLQFSGNDLPEGTYFYIVDLGNGQKPVKGYVYLNRAVR